MRSSQNVIELDLLVEGNGDNSRDYFALPSTPPEDVKKHCHPLSDVHLRIIAWGFQVLGQVGVILSIIVIVTDAIAKQSPGWLNSLDMASDILSFFQNTSLSLFLIANFSSILRETTGFSSLLIQYGLIAAGFLLGWCYLYFHFGVGIIMFVTDLTFQETSSAIDDVADVVFSSFETLNMFVDLFWYTLLSYFILYTPDIHSSGRNIWVFRSLSVIPVAYLFIGTIMRGLDNVAFHIPGFLLPLLPCQSLLFLISFCSILFYMKVKEYRYIRDGHTTDQFIEYRLSSHGVYLISRFTSLSFFSASLVDLAFTMIIQLAHPTNDFKTIAAQFGIGKGSVLFTAIPFIMLFNYAKQSGSLLTTILIPTFGVAFIVILYLEAIYVVVRVVLPLAGDFPIHLHEDE